MLLRIGCVLLLSLPQALAQTAPQIETLRVTRTADNGDGSLRWAIESNNTAPGRFHQIDPRDPPLVDHSRVDSSHLLGGQNLHGGGR